MANPIEAARLKGRAEAFTEAKDYILVELRKEGRPTAEVECLKLAYVGMLCKEIRAESTHAEYVDPEGERIKRDGHEAAMWEAAGLLERPRRSFHRQAKQAFIERFGQDAYNDRLAWEHSLGREDDAVHTEHHAAER